MNCLEDPGRSISLYVAEAVRTVVGHAYLRIVTLSSMVFDEVTGHVAIGSVHSDKQNAP